MWFCCDVKVEVAYVKIIIIIIKIRYFCAFIAIYGAAGETKNWFDARLRRRKKTILGEKKHTHINALALLIGSSLQNTFIAIYDVSSEEIFVSIDVTGKDWNLYCKKQKKRKKKTHELQLSLFCVLKCSFICYDSVNCYCVAAWKISC